MVVHAKPDFYLSRGTLSLVAYEIRPVGVGELLARLERLKGVLAQEGLFAAGRKRPLPFLPGVVGLVTGRASAAESAGASCDCRRVISMASSKARCCTRGSGHASSRYAAKAASNKGAQADTWPCR